MLAPLQRVLDSAHVYIALQKSLGTDRVRYWCLDRAALAPGDRVLDVGCGPAYYLDRLPAGVEYYGFDTNEPYLAHARARHGDRGQFVAQTVTVEALADLPPFDAVLLFGLLHHLADDDCAELLDVCARRLAPGGRVISVDPCVHEGQSRIARWLAVSDRGKHVRTPDAFDALARASFRTVDSGIMPNLMRVPYSQYVMHMSDPVRAA